MVSFCLRRLPGFLLSLLMLALPLVAQDRSPAVRRAQHLRHGINASMWFAQSSWDYSNNHLDHYIEDSDIVLMAKLGFDHVRLSIDPVPLEKYPHNAEGFNPEFLSRLDHAVDTMLANGLAVLVDVHPEDPYKEQVRNSNDAVERFTDLWRRLATHYANRDPERVFFEVMNEPEISDAYRWMGIQVRVAEAIRRVAPQQTLIVSGPNYSGLYDLMQMEPIPDTNAIYNFHFYEPMTFTHQGAGWGVGWWRYTHDIPYPASEDSMQKALTALPDSFSRYQAEQYWLDHWDAHRIRQTLSAAADWGREHHVPVLCNEFGAFREHSDVTSRKNWLRDMRTALEAEGIGWTMWDYRGSFGVVWKQDGQPAKVDADVVEALGLKR